MGVVFYEMLHGRTPWTGTDLENLKQNIQKKKLEWKPNINPEIKDVISRMLRVRSEERITWENLIINPIFAKPVELGKQQKKQQLSFRDTL